MLAVTPMLFITYISQVYSISRYDKIFPAHSGDVNSSRQNTNVHQVVDDSAMNVT